MQKDNIFSELLTYTGENGLSASLIFLLKSLTGADNDTTNEAARHLLNCLCGLRFGKNEIKNTSYKLQVNLIINNKKGITNRGIVDIGISTKHKLAYIEVKNHAQLSNDQLSKYRKALELEKLKNPKLSTQLVLLTRGSTNFEEESNADLVIFWPKIFSECNKIKITNDPVNYYLLESFKDHLKEQGMDIQKIEKGSLEGAQSFHHLLYMIKQAAAAINLPLSEGYFVPNDNVGWMIKKDRQLKYWLYIMADEPKKLYFAFAPTSKVLTAKDKQVISKLPKHLDKYPYVCKNLDDEFFKLDALAQFNLICNVLNNMWNKLNPPRKRIK